MRPTRTVMTGIALGVALAATAGAQYGPQHLPQPDGAAAEQGVRAGAADTPQIDGVVDRVDRRAGDVWVRSGRDVLRLNFPADTVAQLAPGDRVTVRAAIARVRPIEGTSTEGAGAQATDPETGSPGARPPAPSAPR